MLSTPSHRDTHYSQPPPTYEACKLLMRDFLSPDNVSDAKTIPGISEHKENERLAQYIWNEQMLVKDLRTASRCSLVVIDSGEWNHSHGPDFKNAQLRLDGRVVKGDIEIHLNASDWTKHRHHEDFEYNTVILHAFLFDDTNTDTDILQNGERLERLEMQSALFPTLDVIKRSVNPEDYTYAKDVSPGKCAAVFDKLGIEFIERFFELGATQRMEAKIQRLEKQLHSESYDQVFYQSIMTTLGYKKNKSLFFLLAKRTPFEEILEYTKQYSDTDKVMSLQSLLLHTANLVPPPDSVSSALDEESMEYINTLNRYWAELSLYFKDRIIPTTKNWFSQIRPVNFPPRRLAAMSYLIAAGSRAGGLIRLFLPHVRLESSGSSPSKKALKGLIKQLTEQFTIDQEDYWTYRYSFTGKKSGRRIKLIGESSALSIVFNSLIPLFIYYFRAHKERAKEQLMWEMFNAYPALPENIVTSFMKHRLFFDPATFNSLKRSEKNQQALFQIFYDCCNASEVSCESCSLLQRIG